MKKKKLKDFDCFIFLCIMQDFMHDYLILNIFE